MSIDLDAMEREALQRVIAHINRIAAQRWRRLRERWANEQTTATGEQS